MVSEAAQVPVSHVIGSSTQAHTGELKMYNRKKESQKAAIFPLSAVD